MSFIVLVRRFSSHFFTPHLCIYSPYSGVPTVVSHINSDGAYSLGVAGKLTFQCLTLAGS